MPDDRADRAEAAQARAEEGQATAELRQDKAEEGQAVAELRQDKAELRQDRAEEGQAAAELGYDIARASQVSAAAEALATLKRLDTAIARLSKAQRLEHSRRVLVTVVGATVAGLLGFLMVAGYQEQRDQRRLAERLEDTIVQMEAAREAEALHACQTINDGRRGIHKLGQVFRDALVNAGANTVRTPEAQAERDKAIAQFDGEVAEGLKDLQPKPC